jgi:hypothetical protein
MEAIEHKVLNLHAFNKGRVVVKACSGSCALHSFEVTPALTGRFTYGYVALGDPGSLFANCKVMVTDIESMRLKDILSSIQSVENVHFLKANCKEKRQVSIVWTVAFILILATAGSWCQSFLRPRGSFTPA